MDGKSQRERLLTDADQKPNGPTFHGDLIAPELKLLCRWVVWKFIFKNGRWTKEPFNARFADRHASVTDFGTWSSFTDAIQCYVRNTDVDGVGFVLGDGYFGIDIDGCINSDGRVEPFAQAILDKLDTYAEVSPTGTGIKLIVNGDRPAWLRKGDFDITGYTARYFTLTGKVCGASQIKALDGFNSEWLRKQFFRSAEKPDKKQLDDDLTSNQERLEKAIAALADLAEYAPEIADDYDTWVRLGIAAKSVGSDMKDSWVAWSSTSGKYPGVEECEKKWDSFEPTGQIGYRTLIYEANKFRPKSKQEELPPQKGLLRSSMLSADQLVSKYPQRREVVVDGLIRRGEVTNLIGASKEGKSCLSYGLAMAVLAGQPWLGYHCTQGRVLLLDSELNPEELAHRIGETSQFYQLGDRVHDFDIVPVADAEDDSGNGININHIALDIDDILTPQHNLVIVDALYMLLPDDVSENDNAQMARVYRICNRIARKHDVAVVVVHHTSKGDQSDKSVIDVGSGAGSIGRATGSHLVVRPHEDADEGYAVLEGKCRSFPNVQPVTLQFRYPIWTAHEDVEPRLSTAAGRRQRNNDRNAQEKVLEAIREADTAVGRTELQAETGFGYERLVRILRQLMDADQVMMVIEEYRGQSVRRYRLAELDEQRYNFLNPSDEGD